MTSSNQEANAAHERRASLNAWREAADLDRLGHHGGAVSRAYYAAYHAARALLFEKGLEPKTHEGVRRMLGLHYVLPGLLAEKQTQGLTRLAYLREASDYAPAQPPTAEQSHEALALTKEFLGASGVQLPE
jgi:uncharacterized protein (UPF0332 family)